MNVEHVLIQILLILVAAKLAAELSHRLGIPTVVGEIVAGLLLGPSLFGLVETNEVIEVLAELGVILLLVEVGLEMDVAGLRSVGSRALGVATIGVALPFVGGFAVAVYAGASGDTAIFVGAALTATSVGITARVFADLKMLQTAEGRTVLGAAIADDVMGLVILTIVTRGVAGGSASPLDIALVAVSSVLVLAVLGLVGAVVAPILFDSARRSARLGGTFSGLAFAFVLLFSLVSGSAGLAPIIGAFVAGVCVGRTLHADAIRNDLASVGRLFIPVFFFQIGIKLDLSGLVQGDTLLMAGGLILVASMGKILSAAALFRSSVDKLLVGFGMLPRGEVGLIFAALGARSGVLSGEMYGALVLTMVVTTLMAPSLLRLRAARMARPQTVMTGEPAHRALHKGIEVVELDAPPHPAASVVTVLDAAAAVATGSRPGPRLLAWLEGLQGSALRWDADATGRLLGLLREGDPRSWTFLASTGILERLVPEVAWIIRERRTTSSDPDPLRPYRWDSLERLRLLEEADPRAAAELDRLAHPEHLVLAAFILDAVEASATVLTARKLVKRLGMGARAEEEIAFLVGDSMLLRAATRRSVRSTEEEILELASYIRREENARALYLLTVIRAAGWSDWERARVDELYDLVQTVLMHPEVTGREARNLVERRRVAALKLAGSNEQTRSLIGAAPRMVLLSTPPETLVAQAELLGRSPHRLAFDLRADPERGADAWQVIVASPDRHGLLARTTAVLARSGLQVESALATSWSNGHATQSFGVTGGATTTERLEEAFASVQRARLVGSPVPDASVDFDHEASPWYTLCDVMAPHRTGLVHALAVAFAACRVNIWSARVSMSGANASLRFELLVDSGKLSRSAEQGIVTAIAEGARLEPLGWYGSLRTGAPRRGFWGDLIRRTERATSDAG